MSVFAALLAGLLLRLWLAPRGAHLGDFPILTEWASAAVRLGWRGVYPATSLNYPPVGMLSVTASGHLFTALTGSLPDPTSSLWTLCLKLPAILADCGIGWVASRRQQRPILGAVAVALNPALIIMSAWWGQLESVYALGALLAVTRRQAAPAGIWLAIAALVKLQGAVVAPLVLVTALRRGGLRGLTITGGAAAITGLAVMLPFVIVGQGALVMQRSIALIAAPGWLTVNALNLWYLLTGGAGNWAFNAPLTHPDSMPVLAGLSARLVGTLLLAVWVLITLWVARGRRAAAMLYLGVFFFPTQVHERYLFGAVAMLPMHLPLVALHTLNLMWAAPLIEGLPPLWIAAGHAVLVLGYPSARLRSAWRSSRAGT